MNLQKSVNQLSWSDRFAIIEAANNEELQTTDELICKIFGVDQEELQIATECRDGGIFRTSTKIDTTFYLPLFEGKSIEIIDTRPPRKRTLPFVEDNSIDPMDRELFARRRRVGRRGSKIANAFRVIPSTPVPVAQFAADNNVSIAVLRQHKRFDKTGLGQVYVRKCNEADEIMIWRETAVEEQVQDTKEETNEDV